MKSGHKNFLLMLFFAMGILFSTCLANAQTQGDIKPYVEMMDQARAGMTLWQLIQAGGIIIIILFGISIITVALIIYDFLVVKESKLVPPNFTRAVIECLRSGDELSARELCSSENNIISRVVISGLDKKKSGSVIAKEAIENCSRAEIGSLWQNITYLGDIASIAPLIGLLGTVIGMIQAFNVIAFQTAVVKPLLLAGGVSKAMVTTAGGLIVAIPALIFYSYFRGKVQHVANALEAYNSDIIKFISETPQSR